eukprot:2376715-Pleurochrysis_carterae.AAC.3
MGSYIIVSFRAAAQVEEEGSDRVLQEVRCDNCCGCAAASRDSLCDGSFICGYVAVSVSCASVGSAWGQASRFVSSWYMPFSVFACHGGGGLGGRCTCVGVGDSDWTVVANPGDSVSMKRACGDM